MACLVAQLVNVFFFLFSNVWVLACDAAWFEDIIHVCGLVRWTMWNTASAAPPYPLPPCAFACHSALFLIPGLDWGPWVVMHGFVLSSLVWAQRECGRHHRHVEAGEGLEH